MHGRFRPTMLGRWRATVLVGALGWSAFACFADHTSSADADVCARATHRLSSCGITLPTASNTPCTGAARLVARCIVDHTDDCDSLASLSRRVDACISDELDGGDLLSPPTDLPVPLADPSDDNRQDAGDGGDADPTSTRESVFGEKTEAAT